MMRAIILMCIAFALWALFILVRAASMLSYWFGDGSRFAGVL